MCRVLGDAHVTQPPLEATTLSLNELVVDLQCRIHPGRVRRKLRYAEHLEQGSLRVGRARFEVGMAGRTVMVGLLVAIGIVERRLLLLAAAPGVHGPFLCGWRWAPSSA